jgi:hypothetical protein
VANDRRHHQRYPHPLDGSWSGASGTGTCRVADISVGGCFIESLAMPAVGEVAVVTVNVGDHAMSFTGEVLYVEKSMGFAVKFREIPTDQLNGLLRFIRSLEAPNT